MSRIVRSALSVAGVVVLAATASACGGSSGGGGGGSDATKVAFLMPDTGSTRYELHDRPGFEKKLKELCDSCTPLYNNADGSADKQQQQFNSALAQGAKVVVIDPVDSSAAVSLVNAAHAKGVKVIAYDRPIPDHQGGLLRLLRQRGDRQADRHLAGREGEGRPGARRVRHPHRQRLARPTPRPV